MAAVNMRRVALGAVAGWVVWGIWSTIVNVVILSAHYAEEAKDGHILTEARYKLLRGDKARPLLPPHELFLPPDPFRSALKSFARVDVPLADAQAAVPADAPIRRHISPDDSGHRTRSARPHHSRLEAR